jgi:hypothetical protein
MASISAGDTIQVDLETWVITNATTSIPYQAQTNLESNLAIISALAGCQQT